MTSRMAINSEAKAEAGYLWTKNKNCSYIMDAYSESFKFKWRSKKNDIWMNIKMVI